MEWLAYVKLAIISQINKEDRPVNPPSDSFFFQILEWIWVPMAVAIIRVWQRINGHETRTSLLEQSNSHYEQQRKEDRERHREDREFYERRFSDLENLIKNGHQ